MRVHEALIFMALGAILFAPIATTAQDAASHSSVTRQTPPVQTPFGSRSQQTGQAQTPSSCPASCAQDPALTARLDAMDKRITTLAQLQYQAASNPAFQSLQNEIADLRKQLEDVRSKNAAQSLALGALQHHVHTALIPGLGFGSQKMPLMNCVGTSCVPTGQVNVVTWKETLPFPMTLKTSEPTSGMPAK